MSIINVTMLKYIECIIWQPTCQYCWCWQVGCKIHSTYFNSLCIQHQFFQLIFTWGALFNKTECELKYFIFYTSEEFHQFLYNRLSNNLSTKLNFSRNFSRNVEISGGTSSFLCSFQLHFGQQSVCKIIFAHQCIVLFLEFYIKSKLFKNWGCMLD